ncbi:MAG: hypothetical protein Q8N99_02635 [Nanoarchaeota archaeon]|nr:hypothetical protein [Nanoarchaeota archaeon]
MYPKTHILIGGIISLLLYSIFNITLFQSVLVFLASFLIDVDHYLYYILVKKDINLKNSYAWFVKRRIKWLSYERNIRKKFKNPILILHGFEFWTILVILSYMNDLFIWISIGIGIHMVLDYIDLIYLNIPLYSKISQIYTYYKNQDKEPLN